MAMPAVWNAGYAAAERGDSAHDCPHDFDTLEERQWQAGYDAWLNENTKEGLDA